MKTQIEGISIKDVARLTSPVGWILLARPVIYFIFTRRRDLDSYSSVDMSAMIFILYAFVAFWMACIDIFRSESGFGRAVTSRSPILWFLIYSVFGVVSMAWSVNPPLTGFRAFECVATALLIVAVVQDLFDRGSLKFVMTWSLLYCVWDTICSLIRMGQWAPDLATLLQASQMMSTCFFFIAFYFIPRRWYNWLVMVMSIFSMSTVAYIGMILGCISGFWTNVKGKLMTGVIAFIILLGVIAIGPYRIIKNTIFFDKNDVSLEETSGRNLLMNATLESLDENPMGLGFFAAEPYVLYSKGLQAISAHNSLFSAAMGMGIPGAIIFAVFLLALFRCVFSRHIPREYRAMLIGCFCVAFMHCMGNPSVGTRVFGAWMPCMYIFVLVCGFYVFGKYYELKNHSSDEVGCQNISDESTYSEEYKHHENNLGNKKLS